MNSDKARVCVPVCVSRASHLVAVIARAAQVADVIELRLDCLPNEERNTALRDLPSLIGSASRPSIITMRPKQQGGHAEVTYEDRLQFWSLITTLPENCMIDLELDLAPEILSRRTVDPSRVICSHHDFDGGVADLERIYQRMAITPSVVLKIAVRVDEAAECVPVFQLLERAQAEGRQMAAIGMGPAGMMTRILGPSRGSYLTYGSLDDKSATAPGQLTARELRDIYHIDRLDRQTEIMGLIGHPVSHSISPHLHNAAFGRSGINAVFIPFEVSDIDTFMRRMARPESREIDWNLRGFSVTAPHKSAIMKHLDWTEPAAQEIGAVNAIVLQEGTLYGHNTDAAAFIAPLKGRFDSVANLRCAVIGAGGAARAVTWALQTAGASITLFVRDTKRAEPLARRYKVEAKELESADFEGFDVVVNATPLGTRGELESQTPATAEQLHGVRFAYDLVYNPLETQFMREARAAGCETLGGLAMLIAQAVEQFKLWTGKQPDIDAMRAAAERALNRTA